MDWTTFFGTTTIFAGLAGLIFFGTTTIFAGLAGLIWFGRTFIVEYLSKRINHNFDEKIEAFKADLHSKEVEINSLRSGAMTAMASRQVALDKRRLEAVDQIWGAIAALGPARTKSGFMEVFEFKKTAELTKENPEFREMFVKLGAAIDATKIDISDAEKARPFISPMAWALYSAYQAIAMRAMLQFEILKGGMSADIIKDDVTVKLVKTVLPHMEELIKTHGDVVYHSLLDEIKTLLLAELQIMLEGKETDKASVENAVEIIRVAKEMTDSTNQSKAASGLPSSHNL